MEKFIVQKKSINQQYKQKMEQKNYMILVVSVGFG